MANAESRLLSPNVKSNSFSHIFSNVWYVRIKMVGYFKWWCKPLYLRHKTYMPTHGHISLEFLEDKEKRYVISVQIIKFMVCKKAVSYFSSLSMEKKSQMLSRSTWAVLTCWISFWNCSMVFEYFYIHVYSCLFYSMLSG